MEPKEEEMDVKRNMKPQVGGAALDSYAPECRTRRAKREQLQSGTYLCTVAYILAASASFVIASKCGWNTPKTGGCSGNLSSFAGSGVVVVILPRSTCFSTLTGGRRAEIQHNRQANAAYGGRFFLDTYIGRRLDVAE